MNTPETLTAILAIASGSTFLFAVYMALKALVTGEKIARTKPRWYEHKPMYSTTTGPTRRIKVNPDVTFYVNDLYYYKDREKVDHRFNVLVVNYAMRDAWGSPDVETLSNVSVDRAVAEFRAYKLGACHVTDRFKFTDPDLS